MAAEGPVDAAHDQGYVTSAAYSPTFGVNDRSGVSQGRVARGQGEKMRLVSPVTKLTVDVEIVSAHFVDPEGERVRA